MAAILSPITSSSRFQAAQRVLIASFAPAVLAATALFSTACSSPEPPPAAAPLACPYPNRFEGRWVDPLVAEPNAKGEYKLTFKPAQPAPGVHTVGTYQFVRDVTYGKTPEELADCRVMTYFSGPYVAKEGSLELTMVQGTEVREGCFFSASNNPSIPVTMPDEVYRAYVNGRYTLNGCTLTINSHDFDNSIEAVPDLDAGAGD